MNWSLVVLALGSAAVAGGVAVAAEVDVRRRRVQCNSFLGKASLNVLLYQLDIY